MTGVVSSPGSPTEDGTGGDTAGSILYYLIMLGNTPSTPYQVGTPTDLANETNHTPS